MKLFPLICYLILLLASNAASRSGPGILITDDTHGDTIIHCQVYFDNLTRIQMFDDYVNDHSDEHIIASIGMSKEHTIVSINASSRGAKGISGPGSAIFTGGFGILEINKNSVILLNLPTNSNKSVITEIDDIAQWQDRDQVLTTHIHRENQGIENHQEYEVKVRSVKGLKDKVFISTAADGQRVKIDVNYEPEKASKAMGVYLTNVCFIILIVLVLYIFSR